jgi:hypothetical protein
LSSSVQNSEGGGDGNGSDSFADPCQEFKQGFLGVCINISEGDMTQKN